MRWLARLDQDSPTARLRVLLIAASVIALAILVQDLRLLLWTSPRALVRASAGLVFFAVFAWAYWRERHLMNQRQWRATRLALLLAGLGTLFLALTLPWRWRIAVYGVRDLESLLLVAFAVLALWLIVTGRRLT
jgi:hypothetical protein